MSADTWEIVGAIILTMGVVWGVIGGLWWLCSLHDEPDPYRPNSKLSRGERLAQRGVLRRVK